MGNFVNYLEINKYHNLYTRTSGAVISFSRPCIAFLLKGTAEFLYNGRILSASEGDLIYIAPETQYYSLFTGEPDIELYSFYFNLTNVSEFLDYRFQIVKGFDKRLFDNVYNAYDTDFFMAMAHFNTLLSRAFEILEKTPYSSKYKKLKPAIEFIEQNFDKSFSIDDLSRLCNYSQPRFFNLFKEVTGVTPISYKQNIAVQHALKFLSETNLSIEDISERLGFSSANYFRTVFFKYTGKTPKQIRKKG